MDLKFKGIVKYLLPILQQISKHMGVILNNILTGFSVSKAVFWI